MRAVDSKFVSRGVYMMQLRILGKGKGEEVGRLVQ